MEATSVIDCSKRTRSRSNVTAAAKDVYIACDFLLDVLAKRKRKQTMGKKKMTVDADSAKLVPSAARVVKERRERTDSSEALTQPLDDAPKASEDNVDTGQKLDTVDVSSGAGAGPGPDTVAAGLRKNTEPLVDVQPSPVEQDATQMHWSRVPTVKLPSE